MRPQKQIWKEHEPKRVKAKLEYDPADAENKRIVSMEIIWYGTKYYCPYITLFYKDPPGTDPVHQYFECVDDKRETYFRVRLDVKTLFVNVVGASGPHFDS